MKDSPDPRSDKGAEPLKPTAILVVDDEPNMGKVIKCCLDGYQVDIANSGNEAIAKIEQGYEPVAILSDIQMPDGTGIDLLTWIIENRQDFVRRVIFMTADANGELRNEAEKIVGKDRILNKPFSFDHIRQLVKEVISVTFEE